jgi:hypothetical protein
VSGSLYGRTYFQVGQFAVHPALEERGIDISPDDGSKALTDIFSKQFDDWRRGLTERLLRSSFDGTRKSLLKALNVHSSTGCGNSVDEGMDLFVGAQGVACQS